MRDANLGESTGCLWWSMFALLVAAHIVNSYFIGQRFNAAEKKLDEVYKSHFKYEPIPWEHKP